MKKILLTLIVLPCLLAGCAAPGGKQTEPPAADAVCTLRDGRYVCGENDGPAEPYILLFNGRFTVVKDVAVSYQPSGHIRREGNELVLAGSFANEPFCYAFTLTANDTFRFALEKSTLPPGRAGWKDGMVFTPDGNAYAGGTGGANQNSQPDAAQTDLRECFPAYFGLNTENGLDVIVWQMAAEDWRFGLLEHSGTPRTSYDEALTGLKGTSAELMREILSAYGLNENEIYIIPWQNPLSSYIADCFIDGSAAAEAYVQRVRAMLFG